MIEEKNEIYKVVSGDTLSGIAIKTNVHPHPDTPQLPLYHPRNS